MERKLVKQGRDALTITLPAKWLRRKGLKAGDNVYLEEHNTNIRVNTSLRSAVTEVTVDARGMDNSMIWHIMIGKYIDGHDRIIVLHNNSKVAQQFMRALMGMIIEEQTHSRTIFKSIISAPETDIATLMRRVLSMFHQFAVSLVELSEKKIDLAQLKNQEEMLDTTIYYCMRYLNKYSTEDKAYRYYLLCAVIESAGDIMKLMADEHITPARARLVEEHTEKYVRNMANHDLVKGYNELRRFRDSIKKKDFMSGMLYLFAESLYNNLGYLIEK